MKVAFYAPDGAGDKLLVAAVMGGAARHGDEVVFIPVHEYQGVVADADVAACYGVRASSRIILDAYRRAGKRTLFFDKGYWGRGVYTRVAVDAWQPTIYLRRYGGRQDRFYLSVPQFSQFKKWGYQGYVVYAATTQTWHDFYDLGPSRALDEVIVTLLASQYPGRVIYRPRPAYAVKHPELCGPIAGAEVSPADLSLERELSRCELLVTLGSNAAVESLVHGVPVLVLGDNPCREVNWFLTAQDSRARERWSAARDDLFAKLSYCQWKLDEYHSGEAWADIKSVMGAA